MNGDGRGDGQHRMSLVWLWALVGAFAGIIGGYLWAAHDVPTCTVRSLTSPGMCGAALFLLPPASGVGALVGGAVGAVLGRPARG